MAFVTFLLALMLFFLMTFISFPMYQNFVVNVSFLALARHSLSLVHVPEDNSDDPG